MQIVDGVASEKPVWIGDPVAAKVVNRFQRYAARLEIVVTQRILHLVSSQIIVCTLLNTEALE